jgi:hypothetical protein
MHCTRPVRPAVIAITLVAISRVRFDGISHAWEAVFVLVVGLRPELPADDRPTAGGLGGPPSCSRCNLSQIITLRNAPEEARASSAPQDDIACLRHIEPRADRSTESINWFN